MHTTIINSPIGKLAIKTNDNLLIQIEFMPDAATLQKPKDEAAAATVEQLERYFANPSHRFKLPMFKQGSTFQQHVWKKLQAIPAGKRVTYGELANQLQSGPRAIGNACRHNPIPIIVPCHRIVAAKHLGGYAGTTQGKIFAIKEWLLQHETT